MELILNKSNNGIQEVKTVAGGTVLNFGYENLEPDFRRAIGFVTGTISGAVYTAALTHYKSERFQDADATDEEKVLDGLVLLIQEAIIWKGIYEYVPEGNVIIDNSGFHHQKSNDNQVQAFQWAVNAVAAKYLRNAYNTIEQLLSYLDKKRDNIASWKDSDAEKASLELFVPTAAVFQESVYIDSSRRLFIAMIPIMRRIERVNIKPVLADRFDTIKTKLQAKTDLEESEKIMLEHIRIIVPNLAMATAMVQFPVQVMPEGLIEKYTSMFVTQDAGQPARTPLIKVAKEYFTAAGESEITKLNKYIYDLDKLDDDPDYRYRPGVSRKGISF
ncbi:DUF6712 family protein [uncultured Draconibacterium sp.]|uniref:DUF6712 family protein n=1 Tax=uncultured Draconibacterium sp. TaxID=1573823 RepID=UPI0025F1037A|nr:DUF6712 family protein [uncultured Draconibacterium sp.]